MAKRVGLLEKPLTWASLALVGAAVLLVLAAIRAFAPSASPGPAATPTGSGLAADIVIRPGSLAAPDFTLQDQDGKPISVSALRGRVLAITFLDSHCQQLCPLEGDQIAQAQRALGTNVQLSLLVVSVAPLTDTPASEMAFATAHHWSGDWHWLIGSPAQLGAVWTAYSIAVQPTPGNILHSSVLLLVDRNGFERAGWAAGIQPDLLARDVRLLNS